MNKEKKYINYKAFIVLETFPYPMFSLDKKGNPKIYKTWKSAKFNCSLCQKGIVIDLVKLEIINCRGFVQI